MVNWFCFKFWFCFRLLLASIAHFNWFAAIYVNCIYFTLWKSYDILWFWTHLTLCTCFPALRPENYLLVFIKLIRAKRGEHANKSYKEIYELLYKDRTDETNAERELRRIETVRRERRETRRRKNQQQQLGIGEKQKAPSENTTDSDDDDEDISVHSELLGRTALYPRLDSPSEKDVEEQAMPNIRLDRSKNRKDKPMGPGENEELVSYGNSSNTSQRGWRRLVPAFLTRTPPSAEAIQAKREAKQRDLAQKQAKKEESEQRLLEKKARRERKKRQMAELKRRARIERRRKNFADAVDLLLTYLRLITSFAIMVGNIHKTFIPRYLAPPLDNVYDSPDLLMVFTITLLIDVGFFWLLVFWSPVGATSALLAQLRPCWRNFSPVGATSALLAQLRPCWRNFGPVAAASALLAHSPPYGHAERSGCAKGPTTYSMKPGARHGTKDVQPMNEDICLSGVSRNAMIN